MSLKFLYTLKHVSNWDIFRSNAYTTVAYTIADDIGHHLRFQRKMLHVFLFIMVHKLRCSVINNYILVSLKFFSISRCVLKKITSEYDQEMPQSQTTDQPTVPRHKQILFDYSQHN